MYLNKYKEGNKDNGRNQWNLRTKKFWMTIKINVDFENTNVYENLK